MSAPRVIAGAFRGRSLKVPRGAVTRPTGARVREALFNVLGNITGVKVLDLYAGSGALAFEALSRGAAHAVLVEHDRAALTCIRENAAALGVEARCAIVPLPLPRALAQATQHAPFDLVFCDPPWADLRAAADTLEDLVRRCALGSGARLVLEHSARDDVPRVSGLEPADRRVWGDTAVALLVPGDRGLSGEEGRTEP
ncbi:MAG TPA: 16S rRNA (guanine(966)-N(2))-methyltransferase RsmD [Polyangiaceae bacterium]|nr:16S rRNA (guanine(966)-N(2))-methyltransferase RsmD [Polyangiaceae bacterium]